MSAEDKTLGGAASNTGGQVRSKEGGDSDQTSARRIFSDLIGRWERETEFTSDTNEIVFNPYYQKIIGMGRDAVPFLLEAIGSGRAHLFYALECITRENPVAESDQGDLEKMRAAWLKWARQDAIADG